MIDSEEEDWFVIRDTSARRTKILCDSEVEANAVLENERQSNPYFKSGYVISAKQLREKATRPATVPSPRQDNDPTD